MAKKINNDASESTKAIVHQFYIALEKCFELEENESVYIEYYGDVSIIGKDQIEVKKYQKTLTNLDHNLWNTLRNWLDDKFKHEQFKHLILCTTQTISPQSNFKDWIKKSANEKYQDLFNIRNKYSRRKNQNKKTRELLEFVMDSSRAKKLKTILGKITIQSSYKFYDCLHNSIRDKHTKPIPQSSKDRFINNLLGFIISSKISNKNNWEISYDIFSTEVEEQTKILKENSVIFPQKLKLDKINDSDYSDSPFVKKIEDIDYNEAISDAIDDYVHTICITLQEFRNSRFEHLQAYKTEINDDYKICFRKAKRNAKPNDINNSSKDFYDEFTNKTPTTFYTFNYVDSYFRRGLIHNMANSIDDYKIIWDLKDE